MHLARVLDALRTFAAATTIIIRLNAHGPVASQQRLDPPAVERAIGQAVGALSRQLLVSVTDSPGKDQTSITQVLFGLFQRDFLQYLLCLVHYLYNIIISCKDLYFTSFTNL